MDHPTKKKWIIRQTMDEVLIVDYFDYFIYCLLVEMNNLIEACKLAVLLDISHFQYSKPNEALNHQRELEFMSMALAWRNLIFDDYPSSYVKIHEKKFYDMLVDGNHILQK
jgi:hypothetical protein